MNYKVSKETALLVEAYDMLSNNIYRNVYDAVEIIYGSRVDEIIKEVFVEAENKLEEVIFKLISYSIEENRANLDSNEI